MLKRIKESIVKRERQSERSALRTPGGFIVFALTVEALHAIWSECERGFVLMCGGM